MTPGTLAPTSLLLPAVQAIEASRRRIAIVVDEQGQIAGTLTDGDIRRCLLAGGSLNTPVSEAMNRDPITADENMSATYILDLMRRGNVLAIPLVDKNRRYVRVVHISDIDPTETVAAHSAYEFAVIMAGGEGMRLRPLTETIPKPMIEVGGIPLIEHQIRNLARAGLRKAFIAVNYLSHVIEDHFGDGARFGIEIDYIRETQKLGTAGALSLLPAQPQSPIVVMNGDILTKADFSHLHDFHVSHQALITVAAVDYRVNIPYGVIQTSGPYVEKLVEKPSQRFLCNAGIYALSPESLALMPAGAHWNMTDLIESALHVGQRVAVFPIHEYWSDIGTPGDLERARSLFKS